MHGTPDEVAGPADVLEVGSVGAHGRRVEAEGWVGDRTHPDPRFWGLYSPGATPGLPALPTRGADPMLAA